MTLSIFDSLTPNTPNPTCQEKCGPIHYDDPVLISFTASEKRQVEGDLDQQVDVIFHTADGVDKDAMLFANAG